MRIMPAVRYLFLALFLLSVSAASFAQIAIGISVGFSPPALPVYEQPICPGEGYIWTPGYWAWDDDGDDYYWVPGTWVEPPQVGFLWTPGYWGWERGAYFFHEGYWGPHVGWYGGISYGFGYFGHGYEGGRWEHRRFYYNRSVNNVNVTEIHNVYNTTIINRNETRVSYNGGEGGVRERPSRREESYSHDRHISAVAAQQQHVHEARGNHELRASVNQGRPSIAATQRAGSFKGSNVVSAREAGGRYEPPANRHAGGDANRPPNAGNSGNRAPVSHAREITAYERPGAPNTGNARTDQKYQQQQQKLYDRQNQQVQRLQQKQEQDHQRLAQKNADDARKQQVEQRHQQQTQQLQQKHVQQQQKMQQKVQPQHQSGGKPGHP